MADFESLNDAFEVTGEIMPVEPKGDLDAKIEKHLNNVDHIKNCLLYTSPSPRDQRGSRMPSSA